MSQDVSTRCTKSQKPKEDLAAESNDPSSSIMGVILSCHRPAVVASMMPSPECELCGEELHPSDLEYQMQCGSTACHFNACLSCATQMMKSAQNELQKASDGNVFCLRLDRSCPDCRCPFQVALKDIVLLREEVRQKQDMTKRAGLRDYQLSAKELREKYLSSHAKNTERNESKVKLAKHRYENKIMDPTMDGDDNEDSSVSVVAGARQWTSTFRSHSDSNAIRQRVAYIDSKIYAGWEHAMTPAEQEYVKDLMTCGGTEPLAQAADILASISQMNDLQKKVMAPPPGAHSPSNQKNSSTNTSPLNKNNSSTSLRRPSSMNRLGSRSRSTASSISRNGTSDLQREYAQRRKIEAMYPFPVRMPRSLPLPLDFNPYDSSNAAITFIDDESFYQDYTNARDAGGTTREKELRLIQAWVTDSYQRLTFNFWNEVVRKPTISIGVDHIQRGARVMPPLKKKLNRNCLDPMPWRRVVVSSVKGPLASIGVRAGDVITHLDGERFRGNADTLKACLEKRRREGHRKGLLSGSHIVLNAEPGTAYALRILSHLAATEVEKDESNLL